MQQQAADVEAVVRQAVVAKDFDANEVQLEVGLEGLGGGYKSGTVAWSASGKGSGDVQDEFEKEGPRRRSWRFCRVFKEFAKTVEHQHLDEAVRANLADLCAHIRTEGDG